VKLKREIQGKITILTLSEAYQTQDLAVLRAGVTKLASEGKDKFIVIDISAATPSTPSLVAELNALPSLAAEHEVALLIASPQHAELGCATLADAKRKLLSAEFRSTLEETFLNAKFNRLQRKKKELLDLENKLNAAKPELLALQKRNQQLKNRLFNSIRSLEQTLQEFDSLFKVTGDPKTLLEAQLEKKNKLAIISPILNQLGVGKL
jgi:hypothetical protein